jgi:hypothetical protein
MLASGARASARFTVHYGEVLKMFRPLSFGTLKRRERRAPLGNCRLPKWERRGSFPLS